MSKLSAISHQLSANPVAVFATALVALAVPGFAHAGDAQQALVWLEGQQRADGAWCPPSPQGGFGATSERTCVAVTTEVLEAGSGQWAVGSSVVAKAQIYMENVVPHDSGTLARKLSGFRLQASASAYIRAEDVDKLKSLVTVGLPRFCRHLVYAASLA